MSQINSVIVLVIFYTTKQNVFFTTKTVVAEQKISFIPAIFTLLRCQVSKLTLI